MEYELENFDPYDPDFDPRRRRRTYRRRRRRLGMPRIRRRRYEPNPKKRKAVRRVARPRFKLDIKDLVVGLAGVVAGVFVQKSLSGSAGTTVIQGKPIDNLAVGAGVLGVPVVDSYTRGDVNIFGKGLVLGMFAKGVALPVVGASVSNPIGVSPKANPLTPIPIAQ